MAFQCIVDCQALEGVLNGRYALMYPVCRPAFVRMGRRLAALYDHGWTTLRSGADPICWRERKWNTAADHVSNYTMDIGRSWSIIDENAINTLKCHDFNLQLHSDGGLRRGVAAAGGFTLLAWSWNAAGNEWTRHVLARGGVFISIPCNSFTAECIGLEAALDFLCTTFL